MELNGSHIGYSATLVYRQPSWPLSRVENKTVLITQVHHRNDGKVKVNTMNGNYWFPADASVVLNGRTV